ncbi:fibulin-1-like [Clinocottus analis]|uniref:fibulin-1-like n=1 Tax=Clinocottus analis TaxID=304258 RepID=UPI0035C1E786
MAQWTILLFSLYGVLHGQAFQQIQLPTEQECCQDGMNWAEEGQYCAKLNLSGLTPTCRITQEQCCASAVEDRLCEKGIQMSKKQWVCERPFLKGEPWETKISKICCDCCMLGLVTSSRGTSCELEGLLLGKKCLSTAKACCNKNTTAEIQLTTTASATEKPQTSVTAKPTEGYDPCIDSLCSQLCDNGTCSCYDGYQLKKDGVNCEDVNECLTDSHNCVLGQVCINTEGSFRCQRKTSCGIGYELQDNNTCQDIDECALETHNCEEAIMCTNTEGSFSCDLLQYDSGTTSATEKPQTSVTAKPTEGYDPCIDSFCSQLCDNDMCSCYSGYQLKKDGVNCEDVNECLTDSHNCVLGRVCINTEGSFRCRRKTSCGIGYELKDDNTCQDIDECALERHNCEAAFLCTNTEGSFSCAPKMECSVGFTWDAVGSCIDVNECAADTSPCPLGQTCSNTLGSYICRRYRVSCGRRGYRLTQDGTRCEDVNECLTDSHNCVLGQLCINTEGSFRCQRKTSCSNGYELKDDNTCQDIDECALETHNCGAAFLCTNTEGSFSCAPKMECSVGFTRDAVGSCIDVNECAAHTSPCPLGQTCINTLGSYTCRRNTVTCGRGYTQTQDGSRCEDVDECRTGNVCVGHGCVNLVGTYRCECKTGFTFNTINKLCEDINECKQYPGQLCSHKCENTEGSFQCSCTTGFKLSSNNRKCEDIDECDANPCSQDCTNVFGSYECYCHHGYKLSDSDGITCEDIDECALLIGSHVCSYRCSNVPGSFYCTCPAKGYTLAYNGRTCQDIDECAVGSHTCYSSESCFNIQGGFRCLSFTCPPNFRRAEQEPTKHASVMGHCIKDCQRDDRSCNLDPVHVITHISISPLPFRDVSEPHEIVFLQTAVASDVFFNILVADDQFSFDVVKRFDKGMVMGVVRQVKPIYGPKDIMLEVAMNYVKSKRVSHRNIVVISVFIPEFWF